MRRLAGAKRQQYSTAHGTVTNKLLHVASLLSLSSSPFPRAPPLRSKAKVGDDKPSDPSSMEVEVPESKEQTVEEVVENDRVNNMLKKELEDAKKVSAESCLMISYTIR